MIDEASVQIRVVDDKAWQVNKSALDIKDQLLELAH